MCSCRQAKTGGRASFSMTHLLWVPTWWSRYIFSSQWLVIGCWAQNGSDFSEPDISKPLRIPLASLSCFIPYLITTLVVIVLLTCADFFHGPAFALLVLSSGKPFCPFFCLISTHPSKPQIQCFLSHQTFSDPIHPKVILQSPCIFLDTPSFVLHVFIYSVCVCTYLCICAVVCI